MKITDIYSNSNIDNSGIRSSLKINGDAAALNCVPGDIIEGRVTGLGQETKVSFLNGSEELSFPKDSLKNTYVGETRLFQVMGSENDKLVLKDLGGVAGDVRTRAAQRTTVDSQLVTMAEDFAETNGSKEKEDDDNIGHLTEEDYSQLRKEGFSIEDFKAERLTRAIDRIKLNRAAKKNSIDAQSEELSEQKRAVRERAAKAVSDKYTASREIIERLLDADIPVTDSNIASIAGAIGMSAQTAMLTDNSYAYMIKNELTPSVKNIYTSVFSGVVKRQGIDDASWDQLKGAAQGIINEANETETGPDHQSAPATQEDARWLLEYDIPLSKENLVYKKELEELKINGRTEDDVAKAAAKALVRGEKAEDAILIASHEEKTGEPSRTIEELTSMLRLQEIRLSMMVESGNPARIDGLNIDTAALTREIDDLREQVRAYYSDLAKETGAPESAVETAVKTASAIEDVASAPLSIYAQTYSVRTQITLEGLSDAAAELRIRQLGTQGAAAVSVRALNSYESSATEIRADLGDSIRKAFDNVDTLIGNAGLEVTEANRRAVRILGYNSMEITAQSITEMKYYDAKLTTMVEGMKPSVVMSMIKRGFNPLEQDIDSINDEIDLIMREEGYSPEERFSSFLVRMEESRQIDELTRDAYIGIYRLLYQIEKNDGAAIGAALNSGRKLTLSNLLTEARTRRSGIDAAIDDETESRSSSYTNSVSDQILNAFAQVGRNGLQSAAGTQNNGQSQAGGAQNSGQGQLADAQSNGQSQAEGAQNNEQSTAGIQGTVQNTVTAAQSVVQAQAADVQNSVQSPLSDANIRNDSFSEGTAYNMRLVQQATAVEEPEAWNEALKNENIGELTLEQVTEKLINADKHYDGPDGLAAAVRAVFATATPGRRFLKDMGIDDSKNNIEAVDSDPAVEIGSKEELLDALEEPGKLQDIVEKAGEQAHENAELEFIGGIAILSRAIGINEQLARYDLLGQMAGHEHYRLNISNNGMPARINLTVIHNSGSAGTVSLEVNTTDYSLKADLSLTVYSSDNGSAANGRTGRIDGRISTENAGQLETIEAPLSGFIAAMAAEGYEISGITSGADNMGEDRYLGRLGDMINRAGRNTTDVERESLRNRRGNATTQRLYAMARSFLSFMM